MASDIVNKREAIKGAYPNSKDFHAKVDKMSDNQVLAVYSRLMNSAKKTDKRIKAQRRAQ